LITKAEDKLMVVVEGAEDDALVADDGVER